MVVQGKAASRGRGLGWGDFARVRCRNTKQSAFRVLFCLSSYLVFSKYEQKESKYENSDIALDQTLITASVLYFPLILFLAVCKLAMETPANRFLKEKNK